MPLANENIITAVSAEKKARNRIRKFWDRLATVIVTTGGFAVIVSIIGLLALFVSVIAPLLRKADVQVKARVSATNFFETRDAEILALGCDEYQQVGFVLEAGGSVQFYRLDKFERMARFEAALAPAQRLTSAHFNPAENRFVLATAAGEIIPGAISYGATFRESQRVFNPAVAFAPAIVMDSARAVLKQVVAAGAPEENFFAAALTSDGRLVLYRKETTTSLFGNGEIRESRHTLTNLPAKPTAFIVERSMQHLYIGFANGLLYKYGIDNSSAPQLLESIAVADAKITQLGFLIGERSLVVCDDAGRVQVLFSAFEADGSGAPKLRRAHTLAAHGSAIKSFAASQRNRTFFTGDESGNVILHYSTNERTLYRGQLFSSPVAAMSFAPKGDGALLLDAQGNLLQLALDNPHPETSWRAFFGKVWYEGYPGPEFVWQSSGGTDDFEPKLSLIPLIFGTIKGTIYALLIALPLGVLSALYVSQFMHVKLRGMVKPVMEIMAALPSVVLGFIAGLWLAPRLQPVLPGLLAAFVAVPIAALGFGAFWQRTLKRWTQSLRPGIEMFLLIPVMIFVAAFCFQMNDTFEHLFFSGDFRQWLLDTSGLHYDQRNAFVVGLIMGFAVIPIIFTVSEDALSNVPKSLVAASLALGATPWQTALRVVLPAAAPGIFSATMIGLGRAVGETMIVLMATGNTPLMDWNPFNGFRTLSANIAVEIPEAPAGGTLFRTLFLSALILFFMTFVVNTVAEVIRQRMRAKYEKA